MKNKRSRSGIVCLADHLLKSHARAWFITGTDTSVGKTHLVIELLREFQRRDLSAVGLKPICCGDRDDGRQLCRASSGKFTLAQINPIHLPHPVAPIAQRCPPWSLLLRKVRGALHQISSSELRPLVLVEGAGGVLCPITRDKTIRDLIRVLRMPVVVVALDKLGVLNHTLLSLEAMHPLRCTALVLNHKSRKKDVSRSSNQASLERITKIRLFQMP